MTYLISLMIVWLIIEKTLALITVSHMGYVPALVPIPVHSNDRALAKQQPKPIELTAMEKFDVVRQALRDGEPAFGLSASTQQAAKLLFQAATTCKYLAVALTTGLVMNSLVV